MVKPTNYAAYSLDQTLDKHCHLTPPELLEVVRGNPGKTLYHCFYELEPRETFKGYSGKMRPAFGLLHLDLDGPEALGDTRALSRLLTDEKTPHTIFFSGNKGFHVSVPCSAFGLIGEEWEKAELEAKVKQILFALKKQFKTIDTAIFNANRKFRAWNSKHEKSGLYKVKISHDDLCRLSIDEIKTFANQWQFISDTLLASWLNLDCTISPWLLSLSNVVTPSSSDDERDRSQGRPSESENRSQDETREKFKTFPGKKCIERMLSEPAVSGFNRHDIGLKIIHDLKSTGGGLAESLKLLAAWATRVYAGERDLTERVRDTERMVRDAYAGADYNFGCYDEIKKAYCSGKCSLYELIDPKQRAITKDATRTQLKAALKAAQPTEAQLAEDILSGFSRVIYRHQTYFQWVKTHWEMKDKEQFEGFIWEKAKASLGGSATYGTTLGLQLHVLKSLEIAPNTGNLFECSRNIFNFQDCAVEVRRKGLEDYELIEREHSAKDLLSYCHPFNWRGDNSHLARNGEFEKFLKTRESQLGTEGVRVLKQALGICLMPHVPKIFLFEGEKESGKSTMVTLMQQMLGKNNSSSIDPGKTGDFHWETSIGKLGNFYPELNWQKPLDMNLLKTIEDDIPQQISRKGITNITGKLPPIHAYATNRLPKSLEGNSGALERRLIHVTFKAVSGAYAKGVRRLGEWIWQQDPGSVLLAAREGLEDLVSNKWRFHVPEESRKTLKKWEESSDQVSRFINAMESGEVRFSSKESGCESIHEAVDQLKKEGGVRLSFIYAMYKEWATDNVPKNYWLMRDGLASDLERKGHKMVIARRHKIILWEALAHAVNGVILGKDHFTQTGLETDEKGEKVKWDGVPF